MEPDREQPSAELERPRAEIGKRMSEAAKLMAEAWRFDNNTTVGVYRFALAGLKAVHSPGWLQEAIMSDRREHPQSGPGAERHRWFAVKLFVAIVVTIVAAYVTAKLL